MRSADNPRSKPTGPADRNTQFTDSTFSNTNELMLFLLPDMIGPGHISSRAYSTDEAIRVAVIGSLTKVNICRIP